jgi:hypothetical protein
MQRLPDREAAYEMRAGEARGLAGFLNVVGEHGEPCGLRRTARRFDHVSSVRPGTATAGTGSAVSHVRLAGIRFCVEFSACSQVTSLPV